MPNDATALPARASTKKSGRKPSAATTAPVPPSTGPWAEFARVYREHLTWLLVSSEGVSDDVADAAVKAEKVVVKLRTSLPDLPLNVQGESTGLFGNICSEIGAAIRYAGDTQEWAWDRCLVMALDFATTAFNMLKDGTVAKRHVRYLTDLAHAQIALIAVLTCSAEGWEDEKPEEQKIHARLNGFTHQQVNGTLEEISETAGTLRDFLVHARDRADKEHAEGTASLQASLDLHMAQQVTCLIGAMADQLCSIPTIGSAASWATMESIEAEGVTR